MNWFDGFKAKVEVMARVRGIEERQARIETKIDLLLAEEEAKKQMGKDRR